MYETFLKVMTSSSAMIDLGVLPLFEELHVVGEYGQDGFRGVAGERGLDAKALAIVGAGRAQGLEAPNEGEKLVYRLLGGTRLEIIGITRR